jgi:hypothetical protein
MADKFLKMRAEVLGLHEVPPDLAPYVHMAASLFESECKRLARMMPDRRIGTAPHILLQSAALAIAHSRLAYSEGRADAGARFARDSRENMSAAWDTAMKESKARKDVRNEDDGYDAPAELPEMSPEELAAALKQLGAKS